MYAQATVEAGAGEAEEDAEFRGGLEHIHLLAYHLRWTEVRTDPLRTWGAAVDTVLVLIGLGDLEEFGAGFGVDFPEFGGHDRGGWGSGSGESSCSVGLRYRGVIVSSS